MLDGGSLVGHGGAALKVFVGLSAQQNEQLEQMGQLEAPRGRRSEYYWPLKSNAEAALESGANRESGTGLVHDVVLRPVHDCHLHGIATGAEEWRFVRL